MIEKLSPKYIITTQYDIVGMEADQYELYEIITCKILDGNGWYSFEEK